MRLRKKTSFGCRQAIVGIAALLLVSVTGPGLAETPFVGLSGAWSGGGRITMITGTSEPIKCKATYKTNQAGTTIDQVLRCASDTYKFNVKSKVGVDGSALSGSWTETTYNLTGTFTGTVKGEKIEGKIRGNGLLIGVALRTRGGEQQVRFLSQGTEMREVNIKLTKR
jgi:hypothetical protein